MELKGEKSKKWLEIEKQLPAKEFKFILLEAEEIRELRDMYSEFIPTWEDTRTHARTKSKNFGNSKTIKILDYLYEKLEKQTTPCIE